MHTCTVHVCLLTEYITPCYVHPSFHSSVIARRNCPSTSKPILPSTEITRHDMCQAPCKYAATHPIIWFTLALAGSAVFSRAQNRGRMQWNRGLPRENIHPIPMHGRSGLASLPYLSLTHIHAACRTALGRNTGSDNILAASCLGAHNICFHLCPERIHTYQPCQSQIPTG